jgi:hypothetical protein
MKNIFQFALEGDRTEKTIVVKGPLGETITQALNAAYAKSDPVTGETTTEGGTLERSAMAS